MKKSVFRWIIYKRTDDQNTAVFLEKSSIFLKIQPIIDKEVQPLAWQFYKSRSLIKAEDYVMEW